MVSGRKRWISGSIAGVLSVLFGTGAAQAHIPAAGPDHDTLAPHAGFIMNMRDRNGRLCCDQRDAMINMPERVAFDAQGRKEYEVLLTKDMEGNVLPGEGVWVKIPEDTILTPDEAISQCKAVRATQPESNMAKTCWAPASNVLWATSPYAGSYNGRAATSIQPLCYYPRPDLN